MWWVGGFGGGGGLYGKRKRESEKIEMQFVFVGGLRWVLWVVEIGRAHV